MQVFSFPRGSAERIFAAQRRFTFGESEPLASKRYRAGWISDADLGTRGCNAAALLDFLRGNDFETLYIAGDLIDIWSLFRGIYWPQQRTDVIQKILPKSRKGTHVIYIPGNHDELVTDFCGACGNIEIKQRAIHVTACGERILIIHGHELRTLNGSHSLATLVIRFLLSLNSLIKLVRRASSVSATGRSALTPSGV